MLTDTGIVYTECLNSHLEHQKNQFQWLQPQTLHRILPFSTQYN